MNDYHPLLKRQLKRYLKKKDQQIVLETDLLQAIDDTYRKFDADREMLENGMEITSQELLEANAALQKANQELEARVKERTVALYDINEKLHQELAERRRAEDTIKQSENRFRALIEHGRDNISLLASDGTLLWESPATIRSLGYKPDEFKGHNIFELIHPQDQEWIQEIFAKLINEPGDSQDGIFRLKHASGTWQWVEATATNLLDEPSVSAIVINYRDVTERKQAEEALKTSEEQFRNLFENTPIGIGVADQNGNLLAYNEAMMQPGGYSREDIQKIGNVSGLYHDPKQRDEALALFKKQGFLKNFPAQFKRKDGTPYDAVLSLIKTTFEGQPCIQAIVQDVTDRKRAEEAERDQRTLAETLSETAQMLNRTLDIDAVLVHILAAVGRVVPHDGASIMLLNESGSMQLAGTLGYKERGMDVDKITSELSLENAANLREIFETGSYVVVSDTRTYQGWYKTPETSWLLSSVGAPISIYGRIIGFILLDSETANFFTSIHGENLKTFANQAAIAIHNARLFQQAQNEIAQRELSRQALLESQKRYHGLFENSPVSMWEEDFSEVKHYLDSLKRKGINDFREYFGTYPKELEKCSALIKVLDVNSAALRMFHAESKEMLIKSTYQVLSEGEQEHNLEDFIAIAEGRTGNGWIGADRTLTGESIVIRLNWSVVPGYENDYSKVIVTTEDITERASAEAALANSEARLRTIVESDPECVKILDVDGNLLEMNQAGLSMIEADSLEQVKGSAVVNIVAPDHRADFKSLTKRVLKGESGTLEFEIVGLKGTHRWLETHAVPLWDENGAVTNLLGVTRDVTERKRLEKERQVILDIAQGLTQSNDLQEFLRLIHSSIANVIYAENFFVVIYNFDTGLFEEIYSVDQYDPPMLPSRLEKSITAYVYRTGEPVLMSHEKFNRLVAQGELELVGADSGSWLGAPLITTNRTIGVIAVQDYANADRYTEQDKDFLASVASQVALAIERKRADDVLKSREAIMSAVAYTAQQFIRTTDWEEIISDVLAKLGRATGVDRVYVFQNHYSSDGVLLTSQRHEWVALDMDPQIDNPDLQNIPMLDAGFARWVNILENDDVVFGNVPEFPASEQELLTPQGILSLAVVPIFAGEQLWGFIGFDECKTQRTWEKTEIDALKAAAGNLGSAIQRQKTEEVIRESEDRYRDLVENSNDLVCTHDLEGNLLTVNSSSGKMLGYSVDDLMKMNLKDLLSPSTRDRFGAYIANIRRYGSAKGRMIVRTRSGEERIWEYNNSLRTEGVDKPIIRGIAHDITDRKLAEDALQDSQERYKDLFENSPISLWEEDFSEVKSFFEELRSKGVTDFQEYFDKHPESVKKCADLVKILDVNRASLELMQVNDKSVLLGPLSKSLTDAALPNFKAELISLAEGSLSFESDEVFRRDNGSRRDVFFSLSVVPGYTETLGKILVSIIDITDRKLAEESLRASEERYRLLFDRMMDGVYRSTHAGKFLDINPAMVKMFGYANEEEMLEVDIKKELYFSPDERGSHILDTGQEETDIYRMRRKDGSEIWVEDHGSYVHDDEGNILFHEGILRDVTERIRSEQDIKRNLMELEALYENGLIISRLLKRGEIGQQIIKTFAHHLSWHHVTIRIKKENSDELDLIALNEPGLNEEEIAEKSRQFNTMITRVGQGLSGWVVQTGQPLRTGNVHAHPQYIDVVSEMQSGLYMPLKIGERVLGVISVESEQADAFSPQDERLLATLANQAAVAFENARLYQAAQRELAERNRAESALRTSETHYRDLADSITDIMFEMDHNLQFTHWNKSSELLTGISKAEALGKPIREIFGDSLEQMNVEKIYMNVLMNRAPKSFEVFLNLNQEQRAYEINAYPSTSGVSVVAKDVTERKISEIIMQKRFELMNFSANNSLDDVLQRMLDVVTELIDSPVGFFHFMDEGQSTPVKQMWSTKTLDLLDVPISDGFHRSLDQAGVWADAVRQRQPLIHNDYASLTNKKGLPEGHNNIVREMVIPIVRNERIMGVLGIGNKPDDYTQHDVETAVRFADHAWDIIERKQMELTLAEERNLLAKRVEERTSDLSRANSSLARALRVKDEFLANMSHELRTPLNAILGLSESLAEQTAGPLNEKQQRYITTIGESGHHLLSLINDILDLAKIDAGQITLNINKVDIKSICEASLRMVKQLSLKKNQEVVLDIDSGIGLMWADERRLKQMLVNLLSNAVKFTPENGRLGLEIRVDQNANQVSFGVWDNGIGIKENDMPLLFQPFVQLDGGLARENAGTGLGLVLVAQMARLHGGGVKVESVPGQGSRFTLTLPWEPALTPDTTVKLRNTGRLRPVAPDEVNKHTILLMEDTQEVTMMLKDYLENAGYKVITAQDGLEGIEQAKITHPDLILMDIQMPRIDGFEATKRLREDPEFKQTPIVALTALAMPNDRQRCLAAGMDEYISKPVNLKRLLKIIQNFLSIEKKPVQHR
ncbi:MAG TPA: hypothetical protein DCX53_14355 [Anaerolineae bacterium]|nr:hypothetical protein [Anaerolineae bacterium]